MTGEVIPPPFVITDDDKRGLIVVTAAAVLAFIWCCFLIRLWLRLQTRKWRSDDWLLAAATLLDTVQSGLIIHLVNLGLGASQEDIPLSQLQRLGREGIATQILYIVVLLSSKCSVLFIYLRLSPGSAHHNASWLLIASSCLWALISVILIAVPCNPVQYYTKPEACMNRWPKWLAIGTLDIVTELLIILVAIHLVWSLNMRPQPKFLVIFAFSARLPVIGIALIRLYYLYQRFSENGAKTYTFEYVVATQWQMGYAIMSSTITGMAPFLRPFDTEYSTGYDRQYGISQQQQQQLPFGASVLRPRASDGGLSQSYLMEMLPSSRQGSKGSIPGLKEEEEEEEKEDSALTPMPPSASSSVSSPAPNLLIADEHFRPTDTYVRHETEVWVGDRSVSMKRGSRVESGHQPKLIVAKKTEFRVEVDRASRCYDTRM
ncbi:hypothetical protein EJ02DRAFT_384021 [Clathrospora elynae]|uniref:Rhodopsin domain-containing protein n=1 Tax=Clathrospora elynae TaxID=706981 RepID=A0A6A5SM05_9PLEO|nr:hypothetical protein EJ02DRAFT_384021 [Clathrospora elynae]